MITKDLVQLAQIVRDHEEPLSLAYRVLEVRADRYGLGGTDPLEDQAGRAIRVFEGLVLRLPADRVPSIGLTAADLEAVTAATAPAFRKLWEAGSRIEPEASAALSVGGTTGESPLSLRISAPYVVPGTSAKRRPAQPRRRPAAERAPARPERIRPAAERGPARPPERARPTAERGPVRAGRTRLTIAVSVAGVLAALLAWFLLKPSTPPAEATVQRFCSDLGRGDVNGAYQQFSDAYRHETSLKSFKKILLGRNASGSCTPRMTAAYQATESVRRTDGTIRNATLGLGSEAGQWQITSMTVSP